MNRNRKLIIDFCINGESDHLINAKKHVQPHMPKALATKKREKIVPDYTPRKLG